MNAWSAQLGHMLYQGLWILVHCVLQGHIQARLDLALVYHAVQGHFQAILLLLYASHAVQANSQPVVQVPAMIVQLASSLVISPATVWTVQEGSTTHKLQHPSAWIVLLLIQTPLVLLHVFHAWTQKYQVLAALQERHTV
jgi:hypothetical protein